MRRALLAHFDTSRFARATDRMRHRKRVRFLARAAPLMRDVSRRRRWRADRPAAGATCRGYVVIARTDAGEGPCADQMSPREGRRRIPEVCAALCGLCCGEEGRTVMQNKHVLMSVCSQVAEVGVFVAAAAALAVGMLGLR